MAILKASDMPESCRALIVARLLAHAIARISPDERLEDFFNRNPTCGPRAKGVPLVAEIDHEKAMEWGLEYVYKFLFRGGIDIWLAFAEDRQEVKAKMAGLREEYPFLVGIAVHALRRETTARDRFPWREVYQGIHLINIERWFFPRYED